ncbi:MAG TPA: hypothetical protein VJQ61_08145 [Sinomonas sp.]|nr:hypothetical protein [Sinomonas sp.]
MTCSPGPAAASVKTGLASCAEKGWAAVGGGVSGTPAGATSGASAGADDDGMPASAGSFVFAVVAPGTIAAEKVAARKVAAAALGGLAEVPEVRGTGSPAPSAGLPGVEEAGAAGASVAEADAGAGEANVDGSGVGNAGTPAPVAAPPRVGAAVVV